MKKKLTTLSLLGFLAACSSPPVRLQSSDIGAKNEESSDDANPKGDDSDEATSEKKIPESMPTEDDSTSKPDSTKPAEEGMGSKPEMQTPTPVPMPEPEKPKEYDPCPTSKACLIMPLGDSITWGANGYESGGYRVPLLKKAWAEKKSIQFVGNVNSGPAKVDGKDFQKANEGHPGWTIDDIGGRQGISKIVVASLQKHKPNIILLQIGTNDTSVNVDPENIPTRLDKLMETIVTTSPEALLVVAQIVPSRNDTHDLRVVTFNKAIPALVKKRADAGQHVIYVDMHSAIKANANWKSLYFADDLHPKNEGFDVMAKVWWDAVGKFFK